MQNPTALINIYRHSEKSILIYCAVSIRLADKNAGFCECVSVGSPSIRALIRFNRYERECRVRVGTILCMNYEYTNKTAEQD